LENQPFPSWDVELRYVNKSSAMVTLGESLMLMTPSTSKPEFAGIHVTRASFARGRDGDLVRIRFGLDWGLEIPSNGSAYWPFGDLGQLSRLNVLLSMLSTSPEKALPGSGYGPPLQPGEERTIKERVLFPFDVEIKGERDTVVLVPPSTLVAGTTVPERRVLTFIVKGVIAPGSAFAAPGVEFASSDVQQLRTAVIGGSIPPWRRLLALNWIAERHADVAADPLVRFAQDTLSDRSMRVSAILNLGLWHVAGAYPVLSSLLEKETATGTRLATIWSLGKLGNPAAIAAVRGYASDKDDQTARFAIEALGNLRDTESVPMLVAILGAKRDRLYFPAATALVTLEGEQARNAALALLRDPRAKDDARAALISSVSETHADWGIAVLPAIATDEKDRESVRVAAIVALTSIDADDARAAIKSASTSTKKRVRDAATRALERPKQDE
jgi:hypothetical protein